MRTKQEWVDYHKPLDFLGYSRYTINVFGVILDRQTDKFISVTKRAYNVLDHEQFVVNMVNNDGVRIAEFVFRLVGEAFKDEILDDNADTVFKDSIHRFAHYYSIPESDLKPLADLGFDWYRDPDKTQYVVSRAGEIYDTTYKKIRSRWCDRYGYREVQLRTTRIGKPKTLPVARLVAEAFCPPDPSVYGEGWDKEDLVLIYKDNDKTNISADNLEIRPPKGLFDDKHDASADKIIAKLRMDRRPLKDLGFPNYSINILGEIWSHTVHAVVTPRIARVKDVEEKGTTRPYAYVCLVDHLKVSRSVPVRHLVMEIFKDVDLTTIPDTIEYYKDIQLVQEYNSIPEEDKRKISELGLVWFNDPNRSEAVITRYGDVWNLHPVRKYVKRITPRGYFDVTLPAKSEFRISGYRSIGVHRLVAMAFCPLDKRFIESGLQMNDLDVNHIDGNKQNNRWDNLEWCTKAENNEHAYVNNLNAAKYRDPDLLKRIDADFKSGQYTTAGLSEKYGIPKTSIRHIVDRDFRYVRDILGD